MYPECGKGTLSRKAEYGDPAALEEQNQVSLKNIRKEL